MAVAQILANEQATWERLVSFVRAENVDCDLWVGKTVRPHLRLLFEHGLNVVEFFRAARCCYEPRSGGQSS